MTDSLGRSCPLAYRYNPAALCQHPSPITEDVLYIVGGLYGNPYALDQIEQMALVEERRGYSVKLIFNGDFNWFNASDSLYRGINSRVLGHTASLGNVEYELAESSDGAGCGCAYPDFVDQETVDRSNSMMKRLQAIADRHPDIQDHLSSLPKYRCLMYGELKILVLHGDPESLAGWGLARESFATGNPLIVREWLRNTGADVIVCTHTCQPLLWAAEVDGQARTVINNGSAGMGNLQGNPHGLMTRIAYSPSGIKPIASVDNRNVHISLLPVVFDIEAWVSLFDQLWPAGSDAAVSYRHRITAGASLTPEQVFLPAGR
ncbi:metallophosphoesterase [Marinobacter sp.]|uniref:metallophosphoesterase family protein n=1 Tax=Marinobacter sp. TaxID=50741 RepID=UPI0035612F8C